MKIEDMSTDKKLQVMNLKADGMSHEEAIAKVCGEEFVAEVEVIDARKKVLDAEFVDDSNVPDPHAFEGLKEPAYGGHETQPVIRPVSYETIPVGQQKQVAVKQEQHKLTIEEIKKYICADATDAEAYTFLQLCNARGLNPFTKEAYLVKYKGQKTAATVIVGKDAFTKKAGQHPMFDGYEAGVIVQIDGELVRREGTFSTPDEEIVGGWAKVHRKDCTHPFMNEVSFREYVGTRKNNMNGKMEPNAMWTSKPGTMIRKVALVQSLREAFTEDLGGCYDSSEMGDVQ